MTQVALTLPDQLHQCVQRLAAREGISADELMVRMVAENVAANDAFEYLRERAKRGSLKHLKDFLDKVPSAPPIPGDELPPGFKMPQIKRW